MQRQQIAIQNFVEDGGGLIAQHAMGDSSLAKTWPWWETQLGTEFISHPADPQFQTADVVTLAPNHPVMEGIGASFSHTDEWYTFTGPVAETSLFSRVWMKVPTRPSIRFTALRIYAWDRTRRITRSFGRNVQATAKWSIQLWA